MMVLDNGLRVLIGRDLGEPGKLRQLVRQALMVALGVMGIGALAIWYLIGRNALKRMDRMSDASQRIMAGNLNDLVAARLDQHAAARAAVRAGGARDGGARHDLTHANDTHTWPSRTSTG